MSFLDELHEDWRRFSEPAGQAVRNIKNAAVDAVEDYKEAKSTKVHLEKPHKEKQRAKIDRSQPEKPIQAPGTEAPIDTPKTEGPVAPSKKVGCLFSLPVCVFCILWFFPVGLILLFTRLYKKDRISKRTKNIATGINVALIGLIAVLALLPSDQEAAVSSPQLDASVEAQKEDVETDNTEAAAVQTMPETEDEVEPSILDSENILGGEAMEGEGQTWTEEDRQDVLNRICLFLSGAATGEEVGITEEDILATAQVGNDACEYFYQSMRETIDALLDEEPTDQEALWEAYASLLAMRVDEYLFKAYGYGYFTGNYEAERFDYVVKECAAITEEMNRYFSEDDVKDFYVGKLSTSSEYEFGGSRFSYDSLLIGSPTAPDMEAMWGLFFSIVVLASD